MNPVKVTPEYGLIVRRDALREQGVSFDALLAAMDAQNPMDMNDHLISFGPLLEDGAFEDVIQSLRALGLEYYNDFVEFVGAYPKWCCFHVGYAPAHRLLPE